MADKSKVKVYSTDASGKFIVDGQFDNKNEFIENRRLQATDDNKIIRHDDGEPESVQQALLENPFLYQDNAVFQKYILSIEDFKINHKRRTYPMGSILRTTEFSTSKRKKVIKKNLKSWKKEANTKIENIFKEAQESLENVKLIDLDNINILKFILLLIGMALPVLLILNIIPFVPKLTDYFLYGAYAIAGLSTLSFIIALVHWFTIIARKRLQRKETKTFGKYKAELRKEFKQKSRKTEKYYKKIVGKKKIKKSPYPIAKTAVDLKKLDHLVKMTVEMNKRTLSNINAKKKSKFTYSFPSFNAWVCSVIAVAYTLGMMIYELINKLLSGGE